MSRIAHGFSWKLLGGVFVLFVLSLFAPNSWKGWNSDWLREIDWKFAQWESPKPLKPLRGRLPARSEQAEELIAQAAPQLAAAPAPQIAMREISSRPADVPAQVANEPTSLEAYRVPSQIAATGPIVAERIDLDPSITQTPNLPAPRPGIDDEASPAPESQPQLTLPEDSPLPAPREPDVQELPPPSGGQWAYPISLIDQLKLLAETDPVTEGWVGQVTAKLDELVAIRTLDDPSVGPILVRLKQLADNGRELALSINDDESRSRVLRAGYAIVRRVSVWEPVHALAQRGDSPRELPSPAEWKQTMAELYKLLGGNDPAVVTWRDYLLLEKARTQFGFSGVPMEEQRKLAREILYRLQSPNLSYRQAQFLNTELFERFASQLRLWANEPTQLVDLLAAIEAYEHLELAEQSAALANLYQQLRCSPDPQIEELAETVNAYYRNANVRVAISAALVNRMLPKSAYTHEPVRDTIQGAYVEGSSATHTQLRMVLLPDENCWRLGLEARGSVTSSTASSKGPARFYQDGISYYRARKMVTVDRRGVKMFSAEAQADAQTHMVDFETDFDGIPLLGGFARGLALQKYEEASPAAKQEVESKIIGRASGQLDREVAIKLQEGQKNFQTKVLDPLRELKLDPTAVSMQTTTERLIARYRLAGREQVAAHTPRPQAPGDSLLSIQIHESAMNNALEHLGLQGRRVELRELYKEITARFSQGKALTPPDDLPEDVYVTFAEKDPVRVDCQDGRVRLTIRLQELSHGNKKWNDFQIRAYYAPDSDQLDANLVRDGVIELGGERLRFGDQVALRGIFSRVLSRNRKLELVNKQIAQSKELSDQQVTQFVIHDGWLGVALGPKHPERTTTLTPIPAPKSR